MNSAVVNRSIRALVWPMLRDRGFTSFTSRTAWRTRERLIDVVNFQSFNRYKADGLGCTTFSFAINLSIYLADVPRDRPLTIRDGQPCPEEYEGHIRRTLRPPRSFLPRAPDVWFVDAKGNNTVEVVAEAAFCLTETADSWFGAFRDQNVALSILSGRTARPDELTWLPGVPESPARNTVVGYLALALGQRATAARHLRRALEQYQEIDAKFARTSANFRG